jgi:hypothetical protein
MTAMLIKRLSFFASAALMTLASFDAHAQVLWDAVSTHPKPFLTLGMDTSVTMQIAADQVTGACNPQGCHAVWGSWPTGTVSPPTGTSFGGQTWGPSGSPTPGWPGVRLQNGTSDLLNTLTLFKNEFIYGGFRYDTCGGTVRGHLPIPGSGPQGYAITTYRTLPNILNPTLSYNNVVQMITDIVNENDFGPSGPTAYQSCEHREGYLAGGNSANINCINANCSPPNSSTLLAIAAAPGAYFPGLSIPPIPTTPLACVPSGTFDAPTFLAAQYSTWSMPHWDAKPKLSEVQSLICDFLNTVFTNLDTQMAACNPTYKTTYFNTSFLALGEAAWCDAVVMKNNMCDPPAPLANTCICDDDQNGCLAGASANSNCGVPLNFHARQQTAICESYDPTTFGSVFTAQPDDVVNGGCRQNVALFVTDGYYGDEPGVQPEADQAVNIPGPFKQPYWSPQDMLSNAFVFAEMPLSPAADAMAVSLGQTAAKPAYNQTTLNVSFAEVVNRVERGVYFSASPSTDPYGTRVAITSFSIPGKQPAYPNDDYFGHPTRVGWWNMNPATGQPTTRICETDWSGRAGFTQLLTSSGLGGPPPAAVEKALGPPLSGELWDSSMPMLASVPDGTTDRNGDGVINGADTVGSNITYGYMLNGGATQPVVVEKPTDIGSGGVAGNLAGAEKIYATRDRAFYTMAGGYLFAFNGGTYAATARSVNGVQLGYDYNDSGASACTEFFRYLPTWVSTDPRLPSNTLTPQTITNGQIAVRESQVAYTGAASDFATVLVMTQGTGGPNFSALDVSLPTAPSVLGEVSLGAGYYTTAEPTIYSFPATIAGKPAQQTVVVLTSGDGATGAPQLFSYNVRRTGVSALSTVALPAGNYPSSAICYDATGRGSVTNCVVLRDDGHLMRIGVDPATGVFIGPLLDMSGSYSGALSIGGLKFYTHPAVYTANDGSIAFVFGSGDIKNLARPPVAPNYMFKVVDSTNRNGAVQSSAQVCVSNTGAFTSGQIALGAGEAVVSPPIVAKGVVAWSSYKPGATGCTQGTSYFYAMNYQTCQDAQNPGNNPPAGAAVGAGIATSPVFVRGSDSVLVSTSAGNSINKTVTARGTGLRIQRQAPAILYWRPEGKYF